MWRAYDKLGFLEYSFIETVAAKHTLYVVRALGGGLFLLGALIMAYNVYMTIRFKPREEMSSASGLNMAPAE
jgi:cytochrome c oxidase cbb3-type subunit 1